MKNGKRITSVLLLTCIVLFCNAARTVDATGNGNWASNQVPIFQATGEVPNKAVMGSIPYVIGVFLILLFLYLMIRFLKNNKREISLQEKMVIKSGADEIAVRGDSLSENDAKEVHLDTELIAVITAAIAAASGKTSDQFVVRTIRRRPMRRN